MQKMIHTLLALVLFAFAPVLFAEPLDINTATVEQIDATLAGVGKAKAEAIVKDREQNGPFKSVDDLVRVKGIGPSILAKNRDKITVGTGVSVPPEMAPKMPAPPIPPGTIPKPK